MVVSRPLSCNVHGHRRPRNALAKRPIVTTYFQRDASFKIFYSGKNSSVELKGKPQQLNYMALIVILSEFIQLLKNKNRAETPSQYFTYQCVLLIKTL